MIAHKLEALRESMEKACLACGRNPESVHLVAVSKTKGEALIREAHGTGQRLFGENYVQELAAKAENLKDLDLHWHFIGHLQRNKARSVVQHCALIHSVDSLRLAEEINRQAEKTGKIQSILLQIHLGGEESKSGLLPEELPAVLQALQNLKGIRVEGLMTIPPPAGEAEDNRVHFRTLRELMEKGNGLNLLLSPMTTLSMGMSDDFQVAIEEGATLIRIGTAIFGKRS